MSEFLRYVQAYQANSYERRFQVSHLEGQKNRFGLTLAAYFRHRSKLATDAPAILDIGAYPGTLIKILRQFCLERGTIVGTGLACSDELSATFAELNATMIPVDLDPIVRPYDGRCDSVAKRIEGHEGFFDVAFATEIVEHTLDPLYLLREARRNLKTGGLLILSTPNQATLSMRLRLLLGRSVHYPLSESMPYSQTDWRPHIREYTMKELHQLVVDGGFKIIESEFMDLTWDDPRIFGWRHPVLKLAKWASQALMKIPSLRHNLLVVAQAR